MNETKNADPMVDKAYNTAPDAKGFYWVPISLSFFSVFFAIAYALPLFPESPKIYLNPEGLLAHDMSGYGLMFLSPLSGTLFALAILSWAYLAFVGIFVAFFPKWREVKPLNALLFPGLGANAVFSLSALLAMGFEVMARDGDYRAQNADVAAALGDYQVLDFVEITYWALLVLPFLLLIWWTAVNVVNASLSKKALLQGQKKENQGEKGDEPEEEPKGEVPLKNKDKR